MNRTEELIAKSQAGDEAAGEALILENSGLIWSVAKRFIGRGAEADDLYQLACLGFIKAVNGFDLQYGTQFSTYAVPKISGEIRRFLRDDGAVKVSRGVKERAATIKTAVNQLTNSLGREPTVSEISEVTGFTLDEIAVAEAATSAVESIQKENGDDGRSLENILSDTESEDVMLEKISLKHALQHLPEREAMVIKLRYYHCLTQDRVSRLMNISQVQVSRIEKKALNLLREMMTTE